MTQVNDLIIILPGITGSKLDKHGTTYWGLELGAGLKGLLTGGRQTRDALLLRDDDPDAEFLDDGVEAVSLIRDFHGLPGFVKLDGYTKTRANLLQQLSLRNDQIIDFPYDWRRDNRSSAKRLERVAGEALMKWREVSGNDQAKIILVAHSMGGLVSRYYLEVLGGWKNVSTLVTFGTPYKGSINALTTLVNGVKKFVELDAISDMMRSFTSMYQLLPTYACMTNGEEQRQFIQNVEGIPFLDAEKLANATKFHEEIAKAEQYNLTLPEYQEHHYRINPIVGIAQQTSLTATLHGSKIRPSPLFDGQMLGGDGTVPRFSAYPGASEGDYPNMYAGSEHGSLQSADDVLLQIRGLMTQSDIYLGQKLSGGMLALHTEDLYLSDEPILIQASTPTEPESVSISIEDSDGNPIVGNELMSDQNDGRWIFELDTLPPGSYRFICEGPDVIAAYGSFAIADISSAQLGQVDQSA